MLSQYQLKIADLYNIPIGNVKKLVPNFYDKEKYVKKKLTTLFGAKIKTTKDTSHVRIQSITMVKTIY